MLVGMGIDPKDFTAPGVEAIVSRVILGAQRRAGNVVLLHDGGGDRTHTVLALPRLIDELREQCFVLVSLAELLGSTADQLMPVPRDAHLRSTSMFINSILFQLTGFVRRAIPRLLFAGLVSYVLHVTCVAYFNRRDALYQRDERLARRNAVLPPGESAHQSQVGTGLRIAVLLPAFNEELGIADSLRSVVAAVENSCYRGCDIILVDDGSADGTFGAAQRVAAGMPNVRVERMLVNGGKAAALNRAILLASAADVVITVDADTLLEPGAIDAIAGHFVDPRVHAVCGFIKVCSVSAPSY